MRHLNKITFINSANIPYAEVMLDGNVHFAGTQGVGKSTVLRAILFFYNADKLHLGIQQGHRSFDEFYFPHSNSYIVYEVKTDRSAYSILTFRSQGKTSFRFIDAPYSKDWFVSSDGRVESDWIRIRERIGAQTDISPKIDTYDQYRNIIFGNTHDRTHRFDKYAIVESPKYQNIPRSIQNVFLNSKLDADFVKNTIIQSMSDTEDDISLSTYRHLVADFEREFDDIDCWFRKDASGLVPVRVKADKVISTFGLLTAIGHEMRQTWRQLNFTVAKTRRDIPLVEDEIRDLQTALKKLQEKIDVASREYEKEHDLLNRKIAECGLRLSDIRDKRRHYKEIGIEAIITLVGHEPVLLETMAQRESLLRTLQEKYRDVAERYKTLYEGLENELKSFLLLQKDEFQSMVDRLQSVKEEALAKLSSTRKSIEKANSELMAESEARIEARREDHARAERRLTELKSWQPKKQERQNLLDEIQDIKDSEKDCNARLKVTESELKSLRREAESSIEELKRTHDAAICAAKDELERLRSELAATDELLSRWDGSLYEWLTKNKPGWEDSIGKVVDVNDVLYARDLAPEFADGGSLFGVRVNLDAIPSRLRTPDQLREERKVLDDRISSRLKEVAALQDAKARELTATEKRLNSKIAEKQQEETNLRFQLTQLPVRLKDAETRLRVLVSEEEEIIATERQRREAARDEALLGLENEKSGHARLVAKRDKELREAESAYRMALKEADNQKDELKVRQKEAEAAKRKEIEAQRLSLQRSELDELDGKGADTKAIDGCRKEIEDLKQKLQQIEDKRHHVYEFRKDEKDLLSREEEFKMQKRQFEAKDEKLKKSYDDKRDRLQNEKAEGGVRLREMQSRLQTLSESIKDYEQLCNVENAVPEDLMQDDQEVRNGNTCAELVGLMRGAVNRKRQKQDELKRAVNSFHSHFAGSDTFHFISPQYEEDYLEYALNLKEFVENDKIEEFRRRVSDHYNEILGSISREVGLLMNHSAEINGIINEVNRDFQEKNFAGVIRSIRLRVEESSDHMMQLLRSIRDFTLENALSIGELNLFSQEDRGEANDKVVEYLKKFMRQLQKEPSRTRLSLSDTFRLQFNVQENDNDTGWVERINNVGSDGTDILVKAMVNIMLINVFKQKASRKNGDFIIHCMMDEIGKLHPSNVEGILKFANVRNIYLINSSPMGYNADIYRYNYLLTKDGRSKTHIKRLMTINA